MKRKKVDYSDFRLSRLFKPQYSHFLLLIGWPVYFLMFVLTENLIPAEKCHVVHSVLDDWIPFREEFVLVYISWYLLVAGSLLFFVKYDLEQFRSLQIMIMITQAVGMITYIFWPSYQDLRPALLPRQNFLSWIVSLIYTFDTPTGVCPSLHVAYSVVIGSTWWRDKYARTGWKWLVTVWIILICLSTLFIKQHSAIDVAAGVLTGGAAELLLWLCRKGTGIRK